MDTYSIIIKLVEVTIWPLVCLLIFREIKKPVLSLLKRLETLQYKDVELDFGESTREGVEK